jgi:polysaccharide pyruvyl transferase WcaK-like protein
MRIILDNGAYTLRNMGDVAMLQVTVKRLRAMVREPELMILTTSPDLLQRYCPGTVALAVKPRDCAYESDCPARSNWGETWARLKLRWRSLPFEAREFQKTLEGAEAVFLCGGGFLNDINPYQTRPVLRMLTDAARRGKRTALFSQGLGPLESPELIALLRRTCETGVRSALRESLHGPEIMKRARAKPGQYAITGDDAVELAWEREPARNGNKLGFSVRQVGYSAIESRHLQTTARALQALMKRLGTEIVPLPVSFNTHERDHEIIAQVTGSAVPQEVTDTPEALIHATAECRVLVTGTYHAAVFGLALGIPCVCFYVSIYYRNKMEGLARQFLAGCEVVDLNAPDACEELVKCAERLWDASGSLLCSGLRKSAQEQVHCGRRFYQTALGL